jgi:hypothetical protein
MTAEPNGRDCMLELQPHLLTVAEYMTHEIDGRTDCSAVSSTTCRIVEAVRIMGVTVPATELFISE